MVQRGVFIPACDEAELLPGAIDSLAQQPYSTLLVLVVNQRVNASDAVKAANRQTVEKLLELPHQMEGPNRYRIHTGDLDIVLLDHQSEGFEFGPKQGVGRARHIGASTLVDEWQKGQIEYPIFWSTDADARFAADYLDAFEAKADVYPLPYTHIQASEALQLYELSLRYYTLALHWAGSPYAYPTIGSSIAFHGQTYLTTRGFPDRMAGEDFYWLNKARKISHFAYPSKAPVMLIDRPSDRVPFGTGKGSADIAEANCELKLYHPDIFSKLREWLMVLNTVSDSELIQNLKQIFPEYDGFGRLNKVIAQATSPARMIQRRHEFFDAFRTMRWVHQYRDIHLPNLPWTTAIDTAAWVPSMDEDLDNYTQRLLETEKNKLSGHRFDKALMAFQPE